MSLSERVCPVCGKAFAQQNSDGGVDNAGNCIICSRCSFVYHDECMDKLSRCAVFGCRCSMTESASPSVELAASVKCQSCKEEQPASAAVCSKCGSLIHSDPVPDVFSSIDGWQADNAEELCTKAASSWKSSLKHLYNGDFECWLEKKGCKELADKAKEIRGREKQKSVGLEKFLLASGYIKPPVLKCSVKNISVEGASNEIDVAVDISNVGPGYLYGNVTGDVDWLIVQPQEFVGNRNRITVTVDMTALPDGRGEGHLLFDTAGGKETVTVNAHLISIKSALELYRKGSYFQARTLCRRLIDNHASMADACVLSAVCCLDEENHVGAVSDLRLLSGVCSELPQDVAKKLFDWLKEGAAETSSIDKETVFAALEPVAGGAFKEELNKLFARTRVDRASMTAASGRGGSLWSDGSAKQELEKELKEAAALDPALAKEISGIKKKLHSGGGGLGLKTIFLICLLVVCAICYALMYAQQVKKIDIFSFRFGVDWRTLDLVHYDYSADCDRLRIEFQNSAFDEATCSKYTSALLGLAQKACERGCLSVADNYMNRALAVVEVSPYAREIFAERVLIWAQELKKKGLEGEAYIRARQAMTLWSSNAELEAFTNSLESTQGQYYKIFRIVNNYFVSAPLDNPLSNESLASFSEDLVKLGGKPVYKGRVCGAYTDLDGDGIRDLLLVGSDKSSYELIGEAWKASGAVNEYVIYKWQGVLLTKVKESVLPSHLELADVMCGNVSGSSVDDVLLSFSNLKDGGFYSVFVGFDKGRCVEAVYPGSHTVRIANIDDNGFAEILASTKVADSTDPDKAVFLTLLKTWHKPDTFSDAVGSFVKQYDMDIKALEDQMSTNPFAPESPDFKAYSADRRKAIDMLKKLIVKNNEDNAAVNSGK